MATIYEGLSTLPKVNETNSPKDCQVMNYDQLISPHPLNQTDIWDDIDVVNVSITKETPIKHPGRTEDVPATTSTPECNRLPADRFSPICSPILGTFTRPEPSVSPDSSGYGSSSPQPSSGSRICGISYDCPSSRDPSPVKAAQSDIYAACPSRRHLGSSHSRRDDTVQGKGDNPVICMKNSRTTYTSAQVRALEKVFASDQYPEADTIEEISREINVPGNKIKVWFQNRRARIRRRVGLPLPPYGLGPYATKPGLSVPAQPLPIIPQGHHIHPMMAPMSMLPPPLAMAPTSGIPSPYAGLYPGMFPGNSALPPTIPPMYMGHCSFPPSLPYPEYTAFPYSLPSIPRYSQQSSSDTSAETDHSGVMYFPQSVPSSSFPSC